MAGIVLVEDSDSIREMVTEYLKLSDHVVREFSTGEGVVEAVRREVPELCILDLMVPGKGGFQIAKEIRTFSAVPILFLTARDDEGSRITGFEIGADDYVVKPFSPRELVLRVEAILRRSEQSAPAREATETVTLRSGDYELKGEVHCSVYGQGEYRNMSLIVGFLTYVKRAELSGRLDGWSADIEGSGEDTEAVVTIWRKDWSHEFRHRVHWKEAVQRKRDGSLTAFWKKMPRYLLKKTAIAQAFRLAFPAELAGMGYDEAELPEEMTQPVPAAGQNRPAEAPAKAPDNRHPAPEKPQTDRQTIPFPAGSKNGENTPDEATTLENAIRMMLKTNGMSFPRAHTDWIDRELAKKPSVPRLEQIIEHMQSILGDNKAQENDANELIF
ncbi:MAG: response regulator [Spirochaeta sp.]|jgi:CheY-like chemotaxis protein|nr:response regulator [Spirochaeta sp.]